jgi:FkbM family methyltransferase
MKFYSQFKQDEFLYHNFFKNKPNGYFVDIGAYDGVDCSNSLFFEETLGWSGVCVEPNPEQFSVLKAKRKCKCVECAISDVEWVASFFQIKNGGPSTLSGLVDEFSENAIARINNTGLDASQNFDYITVNCKTFDSVVDNVNIDYLSLDTEGNELKILKTIDFNKYNISTITVENNEYDNTFIDFLVPRNYQFLGRLGCDEIYLKNL